MFRRCVFTFVLLLLCTPAFAQRLPPDVVPSHYDITVTPDLQAATFSGTERIVVALQKPSTTIVLNAAEIEFDKVTVKSGDRTAQARVTLDATKEQATFTLDRPLASGAAEIDIAYRGILNDQLRGLYLSKGKNRRYAVTQLEATDARRMFPSFDEPGFKATFALTAIIDKGDHAISNGAIVSDTPSPGIGKHTVKFETSPKMSTYLLALVVGDFECQSGSADGIPIRVCATPDKKGQTGLALEAAEEILRYYDKYYSVKYPFKKLDVVAVPDFAAGAMENTAAIFYRETLLLADPKTASTDVRKEIAGVLAHEMAHQWFGDLVTMKWWDDIWLNEGFATWMETKPVKAWKPEWDVELDEVQSNQKAMTVDSLKTTRPIRAEAWTPSEIGELFDAIAYEKGAAVLRMVEHWLGEEPFRAGVNAYLERFRYGNARAEDFWDTLTKVTGKPVNRVMSGFVDRPGVPLIDVSIECKDGKGAVIVKQESSGSDANDSLLTIPVSVRTAASTTATSVEVAATPVTIPISTCSTTVMANAAGLGYYRVVNSPEMVRALARDVASFTPPERMSMLTDEWALVRAGRHDVGTFFDLAQGFKGERTPAVMATLTATLAAVDRVVPNESRAAFRAWVAALLSPALQEIGSSPRPDDTEERRQLRASLFASLGETARDPDTIRVARRLVESELDSPGSLDSNLLNEVVKVAALGGDATLYDRYLARSRQAVDPEEHYRYLYALASFSDPALVQRTIGDILGPDVRSQDAALFVARLLTNPDAQTRAWDLLRAHWDDFQKKTGQVFGAPGVAGALGSFCDARSATEVQEFFAEHKVPEAERTIQQAVERISTCSELAATQGPKLAAWLPR